MPAAALVVRRRYLIVVPRPTLAAPRRYLAMEPRPLPAAALVVCRKYMFVVPRPLPAAPRRCRNRNRTTEQMHSGTEQILPASSVKWQVNFRGDLPSASAVA
jgi:hypothetical protein